MFGRLFGRAKVESAMEKLLRHVRANGFQPSAVIDVGANVGDWARMARAVFPGVPILMIDAEPGMEPALRRTAAELGSGSAYARALLGAAPRDGVPFHSAGPGSGVLPELTTFERREVTLSMTTLDALRAGTPGFDTGPLLLKLDVQGYELEVLRGGASTLAAAEVVILEVALIPYNEGAPLFAEVVAFMAAAGFVAYDFCGQSRRETDRALFQTDVVFVKPGSALRARKKFWINEP